MHHVCCCTHATDQRFGAACPESALSLLYHPQATPSRPPPGWQTFSSQHNATRQARVMTPTRAANASAAAPAPSANTSAVAATASDAAQVSGTEAMARKIADTLSAALSG